MEWYTAMPKMIKTVLRMSKLERVWVHTSVRARAVALSSSTLMVFYSG
jgi:hypothetical protein